MCIYNPKLVNFFVFSLAPDLGYKSSNLILKQLEKKLNLHEMFNKFLRYFNLTDKVRKILINLLLLLLLNVFNNYPPSLPQEANPQHRKIYFI